ncbi:UDP-N-acetylmuramoyl-tripeptide--D-alanyl-D-alanine ligase [Cochlodiniinecator piscidefendens]|uniref:UDP-N-acetylmuramoyl-tripeptide--D-alanyl-D- alanine ligase n=1 Tax=Cochlodiniinecator piscidefendens TaxID=2715756 RepID=UPI00140D90D3|nr:UDP-N-acetylmuramoyl-tripeptide--D-alanyl-D-alanine ligase [Cochlodiniinecator piscidefendens]
MTLWTASDAAAATGGQAISEWAVSGISIDTRSIEPGDLFVALKDVRDGHDFVGQALEKGAGAALVSHIPDGVSADAPLLLVDDVLEALEDLARAGRARFQGQVVGVTGSVGKTSTKEMLRAILARQGKVHAAEKSFNNHWGVPITLARMPQESDYAVVEIGMNHPGEIAPLAKMARPHVAMITTVAPAHMEAFDGLEGIAAEKAAICEGLEPDGVAIVNGDVETLPILLGVCETLGFESRTFGQNENNLYRLLDVKIVGNTTVAKTDIPLGETLLRINSAGRHFAANALGCLAVVDALGGDAALAARDMMHWLPPAGRGTRETLILDDVEIEQTIELIDDAFNANPTSMEAALEVLVASVPKDGLGRIETGRRVAVLGDMLELGSEEVSIHRTVAELGFIEAIDVVHAAGPRMKAMWDALPAHKQGLWFETAPELAACAHEIVDAGDVVLIKGSKGSKVSLVVDAIRKLGHPTPNNNKG